MTPKIIFLKNNNIYLKKPEFYADFKFIDGGFEKCPEYIKVKS
jgi:hypothetical protein